MKSRPKYGNFAWIPGYFQDQSVIILGSGASILVDFPHTKIPAEKRGDVDFSKIKYPIIGIGHVSNFVDVAVNIYLDSNVKDKVPDPRSAPYKTVTSRQGMLEPLGNIAVVPASNEPNLLPEMGFFGNHSSGYFAINFALASGAKTIYLIGLDGGVVNGRLTWYDDHKIKGMRVYEGAYTSMIGGYEKFKEWAGKIKIASSVSHIKTFPRCPLSEVLM